MLGLSHFSSKTVRVNRYISNVYKQQTHYTNQIELI